jgi:imidazolonepropionase-like amidohydrolase
MNYLTVFLHPYAEASWSDQVTRESVTERTIRAVNHAKATLLAGFTTVRDLGTEGAGDADIGLRKCISSPVSIIPGPRYFCASRAIVTTGSYGKLILNYDLC